MADLVVLVKIVLKAFLTQCKMDQVTVWQSWLVIKSRGHSHTVAHVTSELINSL